MKKVLAMFLALTLVAGMTMTAYAEELPADGKIVVTDLDSHDYSGMGVATSVYAEGDIVGGEKVKTEVIVDSVDFETDATAESFDYFAVGGEMASIHVNGDITAVGNGIIQGVILDGADAYINGNVTAISTADMSISMGVSVIGSNEFPSHPSSKAIIEGNVTVKASFSAGGIDVTTAEPDMGETEISKAYVKGDIIVESKNNAIGVGTDPQSVVVVGGTISVTSTRGNAKAIVADDRYDESPIAYVYRIVENTPFPGDPVAGMISATQECIRYIIRADENLNVSGTTAFEDEDLGVSLDWAIAGTELIVSSNDDSVVGIRSTEAGVDIQIRDNGDGTWTVIVPDGGGVDLQAITATTDDSSNNTQNPDETTVSDSDESEIDSDEAEIDSVTLDEAVISAASLPVGVTVVAPGIGTISSSEKEVHVVTAGLGYFDKSIINSLSNLTKNVVITFRHEGRTYQFVVPADADLNQFLNEEGYAGYLYLSEMFGRFEIIDGKPVLVIPAKAPSYKKK